MAKYVPSVGMEVHAELLTHSKMFCRCPVAFGGEPNTRTCPVCLGMPGTLPVPNQAAIEMVLRTALALNCTIAMDSVFHRKNYFYPDLPKGFQVSQYGETNPLGYAGYLDVPAKDGGTKRVRIRRVHLEEDTGKLMHLPSGGAGVDFNRAGVPLMEIVTDFPPDITDPDEAREYLVQLRQLLLYLGVCDGKMEQGSLRCEPNISVRPEGSDEYGIKTELKNLNSFRSVQSGVKYEVERQSGVIESGKKVVQETRGWNEQTETSFSMRTKESEQDYRYFPCPDLVPMKFDEAYIERLRSEVPELPLAKRRRYAGQFGLTDADAEVLSADRRWAEYFEACVSLGGDPKAVCNWMNSDFARLLNETGQVALADGEDPEGREVSKVTPERLVGLVSLVQDGTISGKTAKEVFVECFSSGRTAKEIVEERGVTQISDASFIQNLVDEVIAGNADAVETYKNGKTGVLGFLVGQVMKGSQGRANPKIVQDALKKRLEE
ncbi:MAG TPA: Asp-tRNA(Asn)/Glu-tRNA(Gln) amidotransferase subunit GatB [Fimbriimonadaceae bacterium]|nr:Asp-tRNA(Asn)/Glu-tRNA(Gln) amidotransferase subunit GatB [Fimbriimonadaceae bacterium]